MRGTMRERELTNPGGHTTAQASGGTARNTKRKRMEVGMIAATCACRCSTGRRMLENEDFE